MASWAGDAIGSVMAKMAPISGKVIRSGERMAARSMVMNAAISGGKPAARAAALGMIGSSMGMGALKGAAIMGGLNMGRQVISNGMNGQSLGQGVGTAGFRGAMFGAVGGAAYGGFTGVFGANSSAWGAFEKAHGDFGVSAARGQKTAAAAAKRAAMKFKPDRRLGKALARTGWGPMGGGYRGFGA